MAKTTDIPNIVVDGKSLKGWIFSDGQDAKYENDVADLIKRINGTQTGAAVLQAIQNYPGKTLTIVPYNEKDAEGHGANNAYEVPTSWADAAPRGGKAYRGRSALPASVRDERYATFSEEGTGKGSDAELHFSQTAGTANRGPGGADDESLLHELVHALRDMEGHYTSLPTRGRAMV